MVTNSHRVGAAAVMLAIMGVAGTAVGGTVQRTAYLDMAAQGPGVCQAALPSFEGQIRKRPLAIQNEGTATAFVSCALPQFTDVTLNDPEFGLTVSFVNANDTAVSVNCAGVALGDGIAYIPKVIAVPANTHIESPPVSLSWDETDEGGASYNVVSCALPPGIGITFVQNFNWQVVTPDPVP